MSSNGSCHCELENDQRFCSCSGVPFAQLDELTENQTFLCDIEKVVHRLTVTNLTEIDTESHPPSNQYTHTCLWNKTQQLTISNSLIPRLLPDLFSHFSSLKSLEVSGNPRLTSYGTAVFASMGKNLASLVLNFNSVRSISNQTLRGLKQLRILDLSYNKLVYIEAGTFNADCCSAIERLYLSNNLLTVVKAELFQGLHSLRILDLRQNLLQDLDPDTFHPVSTLVELYLSNRGDTPLQNLPNNIFSRLTELKVLHMQSLNLSNVSRDWFKRLQRLQALSLRGNRINMLYSDVFSQLENLEEIDLAENSLLCIPSSLDPSTHFDFLATLPLRRIDLSQNRLTHMNHLTVRSLGLFDSRLPHSLRVMVNLSDNPWQQFDEDSFCNPENGRPIRPTDIIIIPSSRTWRTSLGLWLARFKWPLGPFSVVGPKSRIHGLLLENSSTERLIQLNGPERERFGNTLALYGQDHSHSSCQNGVLKDAKKTNISSSRSKKTLERPTANMLAFSLSSYCPRLSFRLLDDWELKALDVPRLERSIPIHTSHNVSRFYLLFIVGVCVSFLLTAVTVIMCYRAWSRRTSRKCSKGEFAGFQAILSTEKHGLLDRRVQEALLCTLTEEEHAETQSESNLHPEGDTGHAKDAYRHYLRRLSRPKSDPEVSTVKAEEDEPKLTVFGIV